MSWRNTLSARSSIRLAGETEAAVLKAVLLEMAQCWVMRAELAEKNSQLDLVYEPPGAWLAPE